MLCSPGTDSKPILLSVFNRSVFNTEQTYRLRAGDVASRKESRVPLVSGRHGDGSGGGDALPWGAAAYRGPLQLQGEDEENGERHRRFHDLNSVTNVHVHVQLAIAILRGSKRAVLHNAAL